MGSCPHPARSVLLISERNTCHVIGLLRYLVRTKSPLPPELLSFAEGIHVAREEQKIDRPLCSYLKSFGVCRSAEKLGPVSENSEYVEPEMRETLGFCFRDREQLNPRAATPATDAVNLTTSRGG